MGRDYKKIVAWERAHALVVAGYRFSSSFPREELYGLTSQLRRSLVSVPSNIAEGSGRDSKREYLQFLFVAQGSLKEAEYQLLLAHELGYLAGPAYEEVGRLVEQTFAPLHGLIRAVRSEVGVVGRLAAGVASALVLALQLRVWAS